jgi:methylated-DNA-protein-cysteine methyltransferase related protein
MAKSLTKKGVKKLTPAVKKSSSAASKKKSAKGFEQVFEKIYRLVLKIPRGRVMTYGQIARLLEERYSPRLVGWAMHATPQDGRNIPWHRVINSQGGISTGKITVQEPDLQRLLLEAESVVFNDKGHCDLSVYQWSPVKRKTVSQTKATKPTTKKERKTNANTSRKRAGHS